MAKTIKEELQRIFEGFEYDEARHARPAENPNPEAPESDPEPSFTDMIAKKISNMQTTIEDTKSAIENEQKSIKAGQIGSVNGMAKINSWQSRLNATQYKMQMLQKALDAYTQDQSEDNELKLKIAAAQNR